MFYISSNKAFKKKLKKKIKSLSQSEEEELTKKKTKRTKSEDKEEEEEKPKKKKKEDKKKKEEEDIDFDKMEFAPRPKASSNPDRVPFQRIKEDSKILPPALQDNSYEAYMRKTGDNFGQLANEKLKVTRGKDFKKEKTKFKNKTSAGGMTISQTVRSIKLEDDND